MFFRSQFFLWPFDAMSRLYCHYVSKVTKMFAPLQLENCIPQDNNEEREREREQTEKVKEREREKWDKEIMCVYVCVCERERGGVSGSQHSSLAEQDMNFQFIKRIGLKCCKYTSNRNHDVVTFVCS